MCQHINTSIYESFTQTQIVFYSGLLGWDTVIQSVNPDILKDCNASFFKNQGVQGIQEEFWSYRIRNY